MAHAKRGLKYANHAKTYSCISSEQGIAIKYY